MEENETTAPLPPTPPPGKINWNSNASSIGLWGPSQSGKTTYLEGVILAFNTYAKNWNIDPTNDLAIDFTQKNLPLLLNGIFPQPTSRDANLNYSFDIYHTETFLNRDAQCYSLTLMDGAGMNVDDPEDTFMYFSSLNRCQGLLLMFDPEELKKKEGTDSKTFERLMILFNKLYEEHSNRKGKLNLNVAVCLTKMDVSPHWELRQNPRQYLIDLIGDLAFQALMKRFSREQMQFFSVSVVGRYQTPQGEELPNIIVERDGSRIADMRQWKPLNLLKPLYWLFEQHERSIDKTHYPSPFTRLPKRALRQLNYWD